MANGTLQNKKSKTLSRLGIFLMFASLVSFIVFYAIVMISNQGYKVIDPDTLELVQTEEIKEGSPTAIITTTMGEIRAVLYPEYAPQTVQQFISLAESGYYDNTYVFEAKNDVYFSCGSADTSGHLPDSATEEQEHLPQEIHQNLWPFKGALCSMNTSVDSSFTKRLFHNETRYTGSRFMVLGSVDFTDEEFLQEFKEASGNEELANTFIEWGGVPNFSQQFTIFGQTYAGLDVIDAICSAELYDSASESGYTPPLEDIQILSVEISAYGEEDKALNMLP